MSPQPTAKEVFQIAVEIVDPADRTAYLDRECGENAILRGEVEELFRAYEAPDRFLDQPRGAGFMINPGRMSTVDQPLEGPGTIIGPYKLLEQIGEGGFGIVYVAEQTKNVRRRVALKIIKPGMDTREVIGRFEAERQALALMDHPNIARVLDAGSTDSGRPYFVMELVKGISIIDYCDAHQFTARERLALFLSVCQAVQHAHAKGIIHRDLKPSNILVAPHDGNPVVKVIDFGIAKAIGQQLTDKTIYTRFMQMLGTPLYMSPEQAEINALDVDIRSDVYSLGVLLYELLTGTTPFDRDRLQKAAYDEIRRIIREEEPPKPSTRLSTLGDSLLRISNNRRTEPAKLSALVKGDLDWIVMKSLEKDRRRRYETTKELSADLQRYLAHEPVMARPPSKAYRLQKFVWRNKKSLVIASVILGAVVFGLGMLVWRNNSIKDERVATEAAKRLEAEARANAQKRALLLAEFQRILQFDPANGWVKQATETLEKALAFGAGDDLRQLAVSLLSGLDAKVHVEHLEFGAGDLAFNANDTRVLFSSAMDAQRKSLKARKVDTTSGRVDELAKAAQGPVAFYVGGAAELKSGIQIEVPVQLAYDRSTEKLELLDLSTGADIASFNPPQGSAIRDDGGLGLARDASFVGAVCTSEKDEELAIWESPSGKLLHTIPLGASDKFAPCVSFSPDASLVAVGNARGEIRVSSVQTGKTVSMLTSGSTRVNCLEFARGLFRPLAKQHDQNKDWTLAAGDAGGTITIWDLNSGLPRAFCRGSHFDIYAVAFSPDGMTLASGGRGEVRLFDVASGRSLLKLYAGDFVTALAFSKDGKRLATSSITQFAPGRVSIWDLELGRGIAVQRGLASQVSKVTFSRDGRRLAALSHDWKVAIWDTRTNRLLWVFDVPVGLVADNAAMAFSPDGAKFAFSAGRMARIWDVLTGRLTGDAINDEILPEGGVDVMAYPSIGRLLLFRVETNDPQVPPFGGNPRKHPRVCRIRNLLAAEPTAAEAEIPDFNWHVFTAAAPASGSYFAVEGLGGPGGEQYIIRAYGGKGSQKANIESEPRSSGSLRVSPTGETLAVNTTASGIRAKLFEMPSGIFKGYLPTTPFCFSSDGDLWARPHVIGHDDLQGGFSLYRTGRDSPLVSVGGDMVVTSVCPEFSPDKELLVFGTADGGVSVFNISEVRQQLSQLGLGWE